MRILLADDDPILVQLIRTGLRSRGWTVEVAADTMQAVMFAQRDPPEAVILDINMPGGTGLTALERLRANVRTRFVPVLVVSGTEDAAVPDRVVALGASGFLPKPVDLDQLHSELCRVVGSAPAGP